MDTLWKDLKFAARILAGKPGFTAVAAVTLALGIGANTALFSVVNAILLRPLPFEEPDRLVLLNETSKGFEIMSVSYPNFVDWRDQASVFETIAAHRLENLHKSSL